MMLSLVSLWTQLLTGRERRMQLWGSPANSGLSSLLEGPSGPWCYYTKLNTPKEGTGTQVARV